MILSHKHKFIFFQTGKAGSTSIAMALEPFADVIINGKHVTQDFITNEEYEKYQKHIPPYILKQRFDQNKWDSYYKFAFVRNTWDWITSQIFFNAIPHKTRKNFQVEQVDFNNVDKFNPELIKNIRDYITLYFMRGVTWSDIKDQHSFLSNPKGNMMVDFIGRYENIQGDFNKICDKIGISRTMLTKENISTHKHYKEYYDNKTIRTVKNIWKKDIETFGFEY